MSKAGLILLLLFYSNISFAQPISTYISSKPVTCSSYNYNIEIIQFGYFVSDVIFGNLQLNYGDGVNDEILFSDYDFYEENSGKIVVKYIKSHAFPGPGIYNISLRYFNRPPDIQNMSNSVNTPLYIETKIRIDPFVGCNGTPQLEHMSFNTKNGTNYLHDFSFLDEENDSLSFQLSIPQQFKNIPVVNYWLPIDYGQLLGQAISLISLDPFNGSVLLNSKNLTGIYSVALQVNEWRKIAGEYYQISNATLDFVIGYADTDNHAPEISAVQDTAIIIGQNFTQLISATDPDEDSIQLRVHGDFFRLIDLTQNIDTNYYPGPIKKTINFIPTIGQVRSNPYKAIFSVGDKKHVYSFLNTSKSMYIWISDKIRQPDPINLFYGQEISRGTIELNWIDADEELGYIVERADVHFPEFQRLVILPANSISYNDSSVVNSNTYQYRIKAVGTTMSDFTITEVSTTEILTSIAKYKNESPLKIYPNPSNGSFWINNERKIKSVEILDLSGKRIWDKTMDKSSQITKAINISTQLSKGIYIVNFICEAGTFSAKVYIN